MQASSLLAARLPVLTAQTCPLSHLSCILRFGLGAPKRMNSFALLAALLLVTFLGIAALAVVAFQRARAREKHHAHELAALAQIENALTANPDAAESIARALDIVLEFSHAAAAQVWTSNAAGATMQSFAHRGLFPESFVAPTAAPAQVIFSSTENAFPNLRDKGFVQVAQMPLAAYDHTRGVLEIAARHRGELEQLTPQWYETVARSIAATLANAQELTQIRARLADEKQLWQVGLEVTATEDYETLLRTIVDRARELVHSEASALCLWNQEKNWWVVQGTSGTAEAFEVAVAPFERGDGTRVDCPVVRFKYRQAHLDLPLRRNGEIVGCLCVANEAPRAYSPEERALLVGIADQAALAVERTRALETMGSRAATAERERLAREIHDTLAQILGFVNIKTGVAREYLAQGKTEQAQRELEQLGLLSQELYLDTRELILGLHGGAETEAGLVPALRDYVERFSKFSNLPVTFQADDMPIQFSPVVQVQLIRVVQEALSNVRKHAQAQHAWVTMQRAENDVILQVRDDGKGFDPAHPARGFGPRLGLQSMRERVNSIHGTLQVESTLGHGTTIQIRVPLIYRGAEE